MEKLSKIISDKIKTYIENATVTNLNINISTGVKLEELKDVNVELLIEKVREGLKSFIQERKIVLLIEDKTKIREGMYLANLTLGLVVYENKESKA